MRGFAISCMALLLLAALVGGPCSACFATQHSCCTSCGHCEKSTKCAAPQLSLSLLQTVQPGVTVSLEESGMMSSALPAPRTSREALTADSPYSPPDLYLRNSVLNI